MTMMKFLSESKEIDVSSSVDSVNKLLGNLSSTIPSVELPVNIEPASWQVLSDPERLVRVFTFSKFGYLDYFLNELLDYQETHHHHAKITISFRDVTVETHTHDLESITRQDRNLAKFCDEIYTDVMYFDFSKKGGLHDDTSE